MSWTTKKIILAVAMVCLAGLMLSCNSKTTSQRVSEGAAAVLADDSQLAALYKKATEDYPVEIRVGDLKGDTLAQTTIFAGHAEILVDAIKVNQKRDRFEPVIGHEMYHVIDARLKYGLDHFFEMVERDKGKDWHFREAELSAIKQENELRQRLLKLPRYRGMAATRDLQNARS